MAQPVTKKRKKVVEAEGVAHIKATFNNTMITITDSAGDTIAWASAGKAGFKGSKKSTPFAATVAGEQVGREAVSMGVKRVDVRVQGPGSGRESAIRLLRLVFSSSPFSMSRRFHTMVAGHRRSVGFKPWLAIPDPSASSVAEKAKSCF